MTSFPLDTRLVTRLLVAAVVCWQFEAAQAANAPPRDPLNNGRQAYSGSSMECLMANDFYAVHFTALQPGMQRNERTPFVKYCQEIPATGKVYLSVDLLDRDSRTLPIGLRVAEEEFGADGKFIREKGMVAEMSAKTYKNGTADIAVDIAQPGHYALIATFGEDNLSEDDHLRIPFTVGLPPASQSGLFYGKFAGALALIFFAVMSVIGYKTWRVYRPRKSESDPVHDGSPQKPGHATF